MTITPQNLIALLPLLITGLTVVVVMLSIAWRRNHKLSATIAIAGLALALAASVLINTSMLGEPLTSKMTGISFDTYSVYFTWLVLLAAIATCVLAYPWLSGYPDNKEEFYLLILISTLGALLLTSADHLATLFLGIEILSLPMFGLIGYSYRRARSLEASIKYMVLSATASSFLMFGIALLYAANGSLLFSELGANVLQGKTLGLSIQLVGFGLLLVGFGFKLSLAPFHLWTPDVYEGAPASVSGFLATAGKIGAFCVLARLLLSAPVAANEAISTVLALFAFLSIIIGNTLALRQNNLKRILGYSSISHLGYLLIAVVVMMTISTSNNEEMLASRILIHQSIYVYLVGYVLSSIIGFGIISLHSSPYSAEDIDNIASYKGLFWQKPIYASCLVIAMLSLAGIPLTLGFIGKFLVVMVGVREHLWWLVAAIVAGSAMGLYYYLRVAITLFQQPKENEISEASNLNYPYPYACGILVVFAILIILLGILPNSVISLGAATTLFNI